MNGMWTFLALMMMISAQLQAQFDRSPWSFGLLGGMQRHTSRVHFNHCPVYIIAAKDLMDPPLQWIHFSVDQFDMQLRHHLDWICK